MTKQILIGRRIPRTYYVTSGVGESDITTHAGSYHLALRQAGIEMCNIMTYSSILPREANEIIPKRGFRPHVHGEVLETIVAECSGRAGQRLTAGIIRGTLTNPDTQEVFGGLVCEYNGHANEEEAEHELRAMLNELHTNGYDHLEITRTQIDIRSFTPKKTFGTAIVAICFLDHIIPTLEDHA